MRRREITLSIILVVLIVVTLVIFQNRNANLKSLEVLQNPQIITLPNQTMLVMEAQGDPNNTAEPAISQLYKDYYDLRFDGKRLPRVAPRARWVVSDMAHKETWQATFGLPLPNGLSQVETSGRTSLQSDKDAKNTAQVATWTYGDVAEILHVGPYDQEQPTIAALQNFVKESGYKIVGEHEEEYIKGPGLFLKGNPKNYYTIIRYRVEKN